MITVDYGGEKCGINDYVIKGGSYELGKDNNAKKQCPFELFKNACFWGIFHHQNEELNLFANLIICCWTFGSHKELESISGNRAAGKLPVKVALVTRKLKLRLAARPDCNTKGRYLLTLFREGASQHTWAPGTTKHRNTIINDKTNNSNTHSLTKDLSVAAAFAEQSIPHSIASEITESILPLISLSFISNSNTQVRYLLTLFRERASVGHLVKKFGVSGPPSVVFVTSQGISTYGSHKGELMHPASLESYICMLQPRTNDMFLVSLVIANLLALVDFFYIFDFHIRAWKFFVRTILRVIFYNVSVFLVWLGLTALMKFETVTILLDTFQCSFWYLNDSWYFTQLRYHWLMIDSYPIVFWISTFVFGVLVIVYRMLSKNGESEVDENENNWFSIPLDSYLLNVLFRPMASLSRPRPSQDLGLEEGMELLIERLATPDLWLHPVVPTDYMKDLPLWRYDGWGTEDDLKSESETELDSPSENENELLESHNCCQDENCRLCELWTTVKEIYVCHRCAILKRKLERQYLRYRKNDSISHQNSTYEKLLKVCENCLRTRKHNTSDIMLKSNTGKKRGKWILSPQRLIELKWTAPSQAIESRVCAICLGKYRWSAVLCGLPCGHNYHHSCITEWLLKDNHHCPTCRWPTYKCKNFASSHRQE
ncbi:unnamed protein product, partial [Meganyctiphanes norvegica]